VTVTFRSSTIGKRLFERRCRTDPWLPASSSTSWRRFAKGHGVAGVTFHSLRHGAATLLLAAGVSDTVALDVMGHENRHSEHDERRALSSRRSDRTSGEPSLLPRINAFIVHQHGDTEKDQHKTETHRHAPNRPEQNIGRQGGSGKPTDRTFVELLIICEEDRTLRAVFVGMLREADHKR
jgi:hypothetical protein